MSISFGSDFDLSNASSILTYTKTVNTLDLQIPVNSTITEIYIQNLTFPSSSPSLPIYVSLKTSTTQYLIARSSAIYWTISCDLPCKTCLSTNMSSCQSCYINSSLVDGYILFQSSTKKCVRVCDDMYFPNLTDNKCYLCSTQCYNC